MKINKLCYGQKARLILGTHPEHTYGINQGSDNLNCDFIFNSLSKEVPLKSSLQKQKENRRVFVKQVCQNQNQRETVSKPLKLRSFSTTASQPKLNALRYSKMQNQSKKNKEVKQLLKLESFQDHIHHLVQILTKKFILNQNHLLSYTIKKEHFSNLLRYLLIPINHIPDKSKDGLVQGASLSFLKENIQQISQMRKKMNLQQRSKDNKLISNTLSFRYSKDNYEVQTNKAKAELQVLMNKKKVISLQVNHLSCAKEQITKQCSLRQQQLCRMMKNITQYTTQLQSLKIKIELSSKELQENEALLSKNRSESEKIYNYVSTQQLNKHIQMASEDYKQIEADIYQYASYLQCNQLASSLSYEPLTITCITENLQDQIKNVNITLVQNDELSPKEKSRKMRDFLLEWMERFKRKDQEQQNLIQFKTKCVINFIEKMKKWLDNWTLKQEYLVNLRNEFTFESPKMVELIESLSDGSTKKKMMELYLKLQKNYQLGNSFY